MASQGLLRAPLWPITETVDEPSRVESANASDYSGPRERIAPWLDALYNACAAASFCGVRLLEVKAPERKVATDWFARQRENSRGIGFDRGRWNEMPRRYFG